MTVASERRAYPGLVPQDRRRWLLWGIGLFVALVVAALSWVGMRVAQAQHAMSHASEHLTALQRDLANGDSAAANSDVNAINTYTSRAHARASGFVYSLVSDTPWIGSTPRSLRTLARNTDGLADGPLRSLLAVSTALSPQQVRASDGAIDLTALTSAATTLQGVERQLVSTRTRLLHMSHGAFVLDPIERARDATVRRVGQVATTVAVASRFATVGPAMLGVDSTRHYLVVVQNNNQARATGGVSDSYLFVDAQGGRVVIKKSGLVGALPNARAWSEANLTPDFSTAAKTWASLAARIQGAPRFDGVIGLDPVLFENVLRVTGPLVFNSRTVATSGSVVRRVEVRYADSGPPRVRAVTLVAMTKQILLSVFTGKGNSTTLASELGRAAGQGHLNMWSAHPNEEAVLAQTSFAGTLSTARTPFAEVVVNNSSGAKLDYFLQRSLTYFAPPCKGATRQSVISMRFDNTAPAKPSMFLAAHADRVAANTAPSQLRFAVAVYTSAGSKLASATLDGTPISVREQTVGGHVVFSTNIAIDRQTSRTLSVQLVEPRLDGAALVPTQPLAQPQQSNVAVSVCTAG
jgi:hypothetical protein